MGALHSYMSSFLDSISTPDKLSSKTCNQSILQTESKERNCVISHEISRRFKLLKLKVTNFRTTLGFRQEEFIQNEEAKVILKEHKC